jgi:hypothetical protein
MSSLWSRFEKQAIMKGSTKVHRGYAKQVRRAQKRRDRKAAAAAQTRASQIAALNDKIEKAAARRRDESRRAYTVIVAGDGPPCPRCELPTQIREHNTITERELRKPFCYRRWYCCMNEICKTMLIMPEEFKVYPARPQGAEKLPGDTVVWGDGMTWDDVDAQA